MKRREAGNLSIRFLILALMTVGAAASATELSLNPKMKTAKKPLSKDEQQVKEVGDAFEKMMLQHLYAQMRKSVEILQDHEGNPFAPSNGERIFRGMYEEQVLKDLAMGRPLGFGGMVERQLRGEGGVGSTALLR